MTEVGDRGENIAPHQSDGSNDHFAAMYDASPTGLAILDRDLRYVRINERLAEWNGVPAAEHIGKSVSEIVPALSDQARQAFERVLAGEALWNITITGPTTARPDKSCVWRQNWVPMRNASGEITGIAVSCEDVSAEDQARRALETLNRVNTALAGEHDLERLVQMVTDAGVELTGASTGAYFHNILDETGEHLHLFTLSGAEKAEYELLGRPRATDVLGPIFRNVVIRSDDITADSAYGRNAPFAGMPAGHPEVRSYLAVPVVAKDGTVLGGLLFGHPRPGCFTEDHEKLILGLAAQSAVAIENARLLSEVSQANEALEQRVAERTAERDQVWRLSRDLLVVLNADGIFQAVNPAWTTIFGHPVETVVGHSFTEFVDPDDIEVTQDAVRRASAGQFVDVWENRYRAVDGSVRWISWLTSVEGNLIYASGRDVTESRRKDAALRETEEALRQSQKMEAMGQLTGGVAHDFNNLLTPIMGSLDLIRRKLPLDDRSRMLIDGAFHSAERAATLVQRLLAFARRQPLQPTAVDIGGLIGGMSELLASTMGPQIRITLEIEEALPPALGDQHQIEMALINLGVNARDAMPTGGSLRIGASLVHRNETTPSLHAGSYVRLAVVDDGAGMDAETLQRAIEPFFSTKGVGRGTGLGLSMVHGLASQLGGALILDSAPGLGTSAQLWLPTSTLIAKPIEEDGAVPSQAGAGLVLLVDDEDAVRWAVADMLAEMGYQVEEAVSGEQAIHLVESGLRPDLLVSDHLMPGMTGTQLASEVRKILPAVGVLIISGYADVETLSPGLAHLSKPFCSADLAGALADRKLFGVLVAAEQPIAAEFRPPSE